MEVIKENIAAFAGIALAMLAICVITFMLKKIYLSFLENAVEPPKALKTLRIILSVISVALHVALLAFSLIVNAGVEVLLLALLYSAALLTTLGGAV